MAHGDRKKGAYLVLRLITQQIELIPTESLDQCEAIGNEIMQGGKLNKFLKGYECVPDLRKETVYGSLISHAFFLSHHG